MIYITNAKARINILSITAQAAGNIGYLLLTIHRGVPRTLYSAGRGRIWVVA